MQPPCLDLPRPVVSRLHNMTGAALARQRRGRFPPRLQGGEWLALTKPVKSKGGQRCACAVGEPWSKQAWRGTLRSPPCCRTSALIPTLFLTSQALIVSISSSPARRPAAPVDPSPAVPPGRGVKTSCAAATAVLTSLSSFRKPPSREVHQALHQGKYGRWPGAEQG